MGFDLDIQGDSNETNLILKSLSSVIEIKNIKKGNSVDIYDFIIVGMGPAACIAAYKLAEKYPNKAIALVCNGPEPSDKLQFYNPPNDINTIGKSPFDPLVSISKNNVKQLNGDIMDQQDIYYRAAGGNGWINGSLVVSDERQYPGLESELTEVLNIIKASTVHPINENLFYNDQSDTMKNYVDFREKVEALVSNVKLNFDNKEANLEALKMGATINENDFLTGPRIDYPGLLNNFSNITKIYNKQVVNTTNNSSLCTGVKMADKDGILSELKLNNEGKLLMAAGYLGTTTLLQQMILNNVPVNIPSSWTMNPADGLPLGDETMAFGTIGIIPDVDPNKFNYYYPNYFTYAINSSDKLKATYEEINDGLVEFGILGIYLGIVAKGFLNLIVDPAILDEVSAKLNIQDDKYYALCNLVTFQGTRDYGGSNYENSLLKKENYVTSSAVNKYPKAGTRHATSASTDTTVIDDYQDSDQQLFMNVFNWKDDVEESVKQNSYTNIGNISKLLNELLRKMSQEFSNEGGKLSNDDEVLQVVLDISNPFSQNSQIITNNSSNEEIYEKLISKYGNHTYHCSSGLVDFVDSDTLKVKGLDNVYIGDQSVLPYVFTNSTMCASQCMAVKAANNM